MASAIEERNLRANVQTNDTPGLIGDLHASVKSSVVHGDGATGLKSVHDAALLIMMWDTFGRAIDTCFAREVQISIAASGELFSRIVCIKTFVFTQKLALNWLSSGSLPGELDFLSHYPNILHTLGQTRVKSKVLTEYETPDLPVSTPTVGDLQQRLSGAIPHAPVDDTAAGRSAAPDPAFIDNAFDASPPAPASASTLAGYVLNWYTNRIWETGKGKHEQNKRADAKAAVNIMLVLYQAPCLTRAPQQRSDVRAYQTGKHNIWEFAVALERTANEHLHATDGRKPSTKAFSLRKR
ncbi:unnamed protein product [Phytophthora fragariaefolia]|uniref:Unnamed protein product n=1 Tax=Phytophthora fragariaefolia TaxID=1490495 RepID=A0A9W6XJF1_9STRA|nr:unnamed protein product [Phytophthora fragariaefolia]